VSEKTLRNLLAALAVVVVGAGITFVLVKTAKRPERKEPEPSRPVVSTVTVAADHDPVRVRGFGSVRAKRAVDVVPQVSGRVVEKSPHFETGALVDEGDVLLRLEDTDYVLAVRQARANVAQAEVSLAQAEEEAMVARREWENIGASRFAGEDGEPSPLVLREPQLRLARANLEAARAAQSQAEVNLSRCTLRAPFTGRVLRADADVGQLLTMGMNVGRVHAVDVAEIYVPVADADLAWIRTEQEGGGDDPVPVDVSADFAGRRHHWQGRAVRLGGAMDAASRMVPVVIELEDPFRPSGDRPGLIEGLFVDVEFSTEPPAGAVVIPRSALRPGDRVWVVDDQSRIRLRDVQLARAGVEQAVVSAGLAPGEEICVSNLQYVTDGMPVRVAGRAPADERDTAAAPDGDRPALGKKSAGDADGSAAAAADGGDAR